jgi:hypothetical protein
VVLVSGLPGRLVQGMPVKQKIRGKMVDRGNANDGDTDSQAGLGQAPKVSDALKKGVFVAIVTWGGRELTGVICDREQAGLLLDISVSADGSDGYVFLPWSSIEQVNIRSVSPRRVKVL